MKSARQGLGNLPKHLQDRQSPPRSIIATNVQSYMTFMHRNVATCRGMAGDQSSARQAIPTAGRPRPYRLSRYMSTSYKVITIHI
jgi:hypothetical protein